MNLKYKREFDEADIKDLHPKLKKVIEFMIAYGQIVLDGYVFTVTRIVDKDKSTHNQTKPYRFIDLRSLDMAKHEAEKLRTIVNLVFPYGKTNKGTVGQTIPPLDHRGTSPGFTAEHFHVQVSARKDFG